MSDYEDDWQEVDQDHGFNKDIYFFRAGNELPRKYNPYLRLSCEPRCAMSVIFGIFDGHDELRKLAANTVK